MRLVLLWLFGTLSAFAQLLSFGVRGGLPLTDFYHAVSSPGATFSSTSTRFIVGPTIELHLPAGFGVEADVLYRRFNYRASANLVDALVNTGASNAWEFPLLVKYKTPGLFVRPFLDAGVAFNRWSGFKQLQVLALVTRSDVSGTDTGFVAGAGIELHTPLVRLSPEVRYTRWGASSITDLGGALRSNQNQVEVLIGLTF
jgi:opacity protein-like surface antigen